MNEEVKTINDAIESFTEDDTEVQETAEVQEIQESQEVEETPIEEVPTSETVDYTEILQSIERKLSNIEGLQTDTLNHGFDIFFLALGIIIGMFALYVLMKEAIRW